MSFEACDKIVMIQLSVNPLLLHVRKSIYFGYTSRAIALSVKSVTAAEHKGVMPLFMVLIRYPKKTSDFSWGTNISTGVHGTWARYPEIMIRGPELQGNFELYKCMVYRYPKKVRRYPENSRGTGTPNLNRVPKAGCG